MPLSLSAAARQVGKSKTTLTRAIKSGRVSAERHEDGTYTIDPAELARVYGLRPDTRPEHGALRAPPETPLRVERDALAVRVEMLEAMLRREQEAVADLKEDRDRWRLQATALLENKRDRPAENRASRWGFWQARNRHTP